jgi:hypothetical protein
MAQKRPRADLRASAMRHPCAALGRKRRDAARPPPGFGATGRRSVQSL